MGVVGCLPTGNPGFVTLALSRAWRPVATKEYITDFCSTGQIDTAPRACRACLCGFLAQSAAVHLNDPVGNGGCFRQVMGDM